MPDVYAAPSAQAWLAALGLSSRELVVRVGGLHWTGFARVLRGDTPMSAALVNRAAGAFGLSPHETAHLHLLAALERSGGAGLAPWLASAAERLPDEAARILRLQRAELPNPEPLLAHLGDRMGLDEAQRAEVAKRLAHDRLTWAIEASAAYGRDVPPHPPESPPLERVQAALTGLREDVRFGELGCFMGLHQAIDEEGLADTVRALADVHREFAGRSAPGRPYVLHMGALVLTRPLPPGARPGATTVAVPDPLDLVDHVARHHTLWLRAVLPEIERLARVRADIRHRWARGPVPTLALTAFLLGLPLDDARVAQARPRFARIRAGDDDRVEGLRPSEVRAVATALGQDESLLQLVVARDAAEGEERETLERAIGTELVRLRAVQVAGDTLVRHPAAAVLYELLQCSTDADDPAWAQAVCWPEATASELGATLALLRETRAIRSDGGGGALAVAARGLLVTRRSTTPVEERLRIGHLQNLARARAAADNPDAPPSHSFSQTVHLPASALGTARRRLAETVRATQARAERGRAGWDRVIQLHAWLCPLDPG